MAQVRIARGGDRVVVVLDNVVEHAHRSADRALELGQIQLAVDDVRRKVDRTQVADRDLLAGPGVERDLGAQVGAMHHAHVLLRRADVARVLECDPWVPGFEQHAQHLAPQVHRRQALEVLQTPRIGLTLVVLVALREGGADQIVQVWRLVRREQRPLAFFHHALHEQVGHPVGRVHVVRAAAVVAGVLAQLEKFLDVAVPGLQVGADRALAFAALIHRHGRIVRHLQERHHAIGLAVGALDVTAHAAHRRPVVAEAAGKLGQHRVVVDRVEDAVQIVRHLREVAARQLRAQRAAVEQGRRRAHEVETRQQLVELDRAGLAVDLVHRQAHRHAHEERLRQLEAHLVAVDEVTVVQRLEAEKVEIAVALAIQRRAQRVEVEQAQPGIDQFQLGGAMDVGAEVFGVQPLHFLGGGARLGEPQERERLMAERVQQQARRYVGVIGLLLDARTRR